jgi:hypothetical protein
MRRLLVAITAVLLGAAVQGCSRPGASGPGASTEEVSCALPPPPAAGAEAALAGHPAVMASSGPTTIVDGVAMGYSPDAAGAEAAARQFVRTSGSLVAMAPGEAAAAQRVMAAAAIEEDLVATRSAELQNIWGTAGTEDVSYWFTPIASRASLTDPGEALAEVWYMGVLRSPLTPGMQWWRTATYELVWEDEDWRIAQESEMAGPIPTLPVGETPTSAAEMDALLEGFDPRG